jgi:hypothetical protein
MSDSVRVLARPNHVGDRQGEEGRLDISRASEDREVGLKRMRLDNDTVHTEGGCER